MCSLIINIAIIIIIIMPLRSVCGVVMWSLCLIFVCVSVGHIRDACKMAEPL